jgi:hypothetical protein
MRTRFIERAKERARLARRFVAAPALSRMCMALLRVAAITGDCMPRDMTGACRVFSYSILTFSVLLRTDVRRRRDTLSQRRNRA